MDFLGSLLGSMTAPPAMSDKEKLKRKQERELAKKEEERLREETKMFRQKIETKINAFQQSGNDFKLKFDPMGMVERQVIHDVAEIAGLVAHSFGDEGINRHVVVWKKETSPSEEELSALRQGRPWDPEKAAHEKAELDLRRREEENIDKKRKKDQFVPRTNYRQKYEHLIGSEAALEAARKTEMNKSYGMVSAESKKDRRTVEDIQADIRAKKKKKLTDEHE